MMGAVLRTGDGPLVKTAHLADLLSLLRLDAVSGNGGAVFEIMGSKGVGAAFLITAVLAGVDTLAGILTGRRPKLGILHGMYIVCGKGLHHMGLPTGNTGSAALPFRDACGGDGFKQHSVIVGDGGNGLCVAVPALGTGVGQNTFFCAGGAPCALGRIAMVTGFGVGHCPAPADGYHHN